MKKWLPILAVFAGLGSCISCKHSPDAASKAKVVAVKETNKRVDNRAAAPEASTEPSRAGSASTETDPFDRYLAAEKAHTHEPALMRFTSECGVDILATKPKYAQKPQETWNLAPDLSHAKDDLNSDFYGTVAVWHQADRIAIERWGMELDTGDYYRLFYCMKGKTITSVESVSWSIPESADSGSLNWAYEHRWKLNSKGSFDTLSQRFVDLEEKPMAPPRLDAETLKNLEDEAVGATTWADLDLPTALLQ